MKLLISFLLLFTYLGTHAQNLLKNPSWENGYSYYNSGKYEPRKEQFWGRANATAAITSRHKKDGLSSLEINNHSKLSPHIYKTMCQRISGLKKHTDYKISFWVKGKNAKSGTLHLIFDGPWNKRAYAPAGTYDWQKIEYTYNTGNDNFLDFRILTQDVGTVWLDKMQVIEASKESGGGSGDSSN